MATMQNVLVLKQLPQIQAQQVQDDQILVTIIQKEKRKKRCWVRPWLNVESRIQFGHYHRLMPELPHEDTASFFNFLRVGLPPDLV